jgi:hypothetical protein
MNGLTRIGRDQTAIIFTDDGSREIGLWTHIQGPRLGMVLRDAAQLVFGPGDTFLYARGPHPQFFGASFCEALVPIDNARRGWPPSPRTSTARGGLRASRPRAAVQLIQTRQEPKPTA